MADKKLYDMNGKEYDADFNALSVIFYLPISMIIFFFIGGLFGPVGASIVLWLFVFALAAIMYELPFSHIGRIISLIYVSIAFLISSLITLKSLGLADTQSTYGFFIILGIGFIVSFFNLPYGTVLNYNPLVNQPRNNTRIQQPMYGYQTPNNLQRVPVQTRFSVVDDMVTDPLIASQKLERDINEAMSHAQTAHERTNIDTDANIARMMLEDRNRRYNESHPRVMNVQQNVPHSSQNNIQPTIVFCPECGAKNAGKFCTTCGNKIE